MSPFVLYGRGNDREAFLTGILNGLFRRRWFEVSVDSFPKNLALSLGLAFGWLLSVAQIIRDKKENGLVKTWLHLRQVPTNDAGSGTGLVPRGSRGCRLGANSEQNGRDR